MPWRGLRPNQSSHGNLRRHSNVDSSTHLPSESADHEVVSMATESRRSFAVGRSSNPDVQDVQEQSPRHRRFSLLRYHNASDPQLSTTSKAHAPSITPMSNLPPSTSHTIMRTLLFLSPTLKLTVKCVRISSRHNHHGAHYGQYGSLTQEKIVFCSSSPTKRITHRQEPETSTF